MAITSVTSGQEVPLIGGDVRLETVHSLNRIHRVPRLVHASPSLAHLCRVGPQTRPCLAAAQTGGRHHQVADCGCLAQNWVNLLVRTLAHTAWLRGRNGSAYELSPQLGDLALSIGTIRSLHASQVLHGTTNGLIPASLFDILSPSYPASPPAVREPSKYISLSCLILSLSLSTSLYLPSTFSLSRACGDLFYGTRGAFATEDNFD